MLHGEAIAVGMICEGYLSHKYNSLSREELDELILMIRAVFPDYRFSTAIYPELIDFMRNDKKNTSGKIGFALLKQLGECDFNNFVDEEKIMESLDFYCQLLES